MFVVFSFLTIIDYNRPSIFSLACNRPSLPLFALAPFVNHNNPFSLIPFCNHLFLFSLCSARWYLFHFSVQPRSIFCYLFLFLASLLFFPLPSFLFRDSLPYFFCDSPSSDIHFSSSSRIHLNCFLPIAFSSLTYHLCPLFHLAHFFSLFPDLL